MVERRGVGIQPFGVMPMLLLLSLVLATSVEGWSHNGALGDSTPFQLFADT